MRTIRIVFLLYTSSRSAGMRPDQIGAVDDVRTEMVHCFVNFLRYNFRPGQLKRVD